jgi:hypothetical protein
MDPFTARRLTRFVQDHRQRTGQLPTLKDFEEQGVDRKTVDQAVREKVLAQFYVTLTNGTVLKGYRVGDGG